MWYILVPMGTTRRQTGLKLDQALYGRLQARRIASGMSAAQIMSRALIAYLDAQDESERAFRRFQAETRATLNRKDQP